MNSNIPLKEIQNVLGHTELNTTQKYLHSNQEKNKKGHSKCPLIARDVSVSLISSIYKK